MQDDLDTDHDDTPDILSQEADFRLTRLQHVFKKDEWWSALIEIEGTIDAFIQNAMERGLGTRAPNLPPIPDDDVQFLVPVAYDASDRAAPFDDQPVSIFARKSAIDQLNRRPEPGQSANKWHVRSLVLGATFDQEMFDFDADWPDTTPHPPIDEKATVMAVIDDGIAIAHNLFRDGVVSSRVAYAALLGAIPVCGEGQGTTVGRVLDKRNIDALLNDCTSDGLLDEDLFYSRTGQVDFFNQIFSTVALRSSHGSHVMGLAAGQLMDDTGGPERPIICAALPSRLVEDTSGVDLLPSFYLAFQMLVNEARRFRTKTGSLAKVVFNLSYGNSGGPHDGTGLFARLFEHYFGPDAELHSDPQKAWLTLPAGNANLSRLHGVAPAGATETTFDLSVLPDDRTSGAVQIWMPYAGANPSQAVIEVTSPTGESQQVTTTGTPAACFTDPAGAEIARLSYAFSAGRTQRGLVQLSLSPTASIDQSEPVAPSGIWRIKVLRKADAQDQIELWVRRDETLPGLRPGGKQAFLDNPCYVRFGDYGVPLRTDPPDSDCPVRRAGTLSGFACGQSPVVVAAYSARTEELSGYSASGPCNRPSSEFGSDRNGPDLTAEGDESVILGGVLSAGSRSGTLVRRAGTSISAPRIARAASVAIHDFKGTGREWAKDPVSYVPGMKKLDPNTAVDPTQAGSGKYSFAVDLNRIK